MVNHIWKVLYI